MRKIIWISAFAAGQGLGDVQQLFEGLGDLDHVALSIRKGKVVAFLAGRVTNTTMPASALGLKAEQVSTNSMLVGHADSVDQAMQRMASATPISAMALTAARIRQGVPFWAVGSPASVWSDASGFRAFYLRGWIQDRLQVDLILESGGREPSPATLKNLQAVAGATMTLDGNNVRLTFPVDPRSTGPLGSNFAALIESARLIPPRDLKSAKRKPTISGLE